MRSRRRRKVPAACEAFAGRLPRLAVLRARQACEPVATRPRSAGRLRALREPGYVQADRSTPRSHRHRRTAGEWAAVDDCAACAQWAETSLIVVQSPGTFFILDREPARCGDWPLTSMSIK